MTRQSTLDDDMATYNDTMTIPSGKLLIMLDQSFGPLKSATFLSVSMTLLWSTAEAPESPSKSKSRLLLEREVLTEIEN